MRRIVYCDTKLDEINEVQLDNYRVNHFPLILGEKPVCPVGFDYDHNILVTANYNNSITFIDIEKLDEYYNLCIGGRPCDVSIYMDKAYIVCSDSNSLNIVDLHEKNCVISIPLGGFPSSIEIDKDTGLGYIVNFLGNSLYIIDCNENVVLKNINNLNHPTKVALSKDKKSIFVAESCCEDEDKGVITIISTNDYCVLKKIQVGMMPVDMCENDNLLYVTNLSDGSISVINLLELIKSASYKIGGMPNRILKYNNYIYVNDYLDGGLYQIEMDKLLIKKIASGRQPNAMKII